MKEKIFERIAVRPPYFALENIERIDGGLKADIPVEQYSEFEFPPITASEAARHLAILGSCAIGMQDCFDSQYYFLAQKATFKRLINRSISADKLTGFASAKILDGKRIRKAGAETFLKLPTGETIIKIDIEYFVVPKKIQDKRAENYRLDMRRPSRVDFPDVSRRRNPYASDEALKYLKNINISENEITATLGKIDPILCFGHFPQYPVLPIAYIAYYKSYLAALLLSTMHHEKTKCIVKHTDVDAYKLAFANTHINFEIVFSTKNKNDFTFFCYSKDDTNNNIGKLEITLTQK